MKITHFTPQQIETHLPEFIDMLTLTVNAGASIGWLAPLSEKDAQTYWQAVMTQVESGDKILLVAEKEDIVVGAVQLGLESRANGNHRAEVQKLMVHPDYRRQGIARQLMEQLDTSARNANVSLLVLDVRKSDPAETLYQQMSFTHVGDIPNYARSSNMKLDATAFYYKVLQ